MKFQVTFNRCYSALHEAICDAAAESIGLEIEPDDFSRVKNERCEQMTAACEKWFAASSILTVEIDTEAGTCVVVPVDG